MNRRLNCYFITFILPILCCTCLTQAEEKKLAIGVSTALTGNAAAWGIDIKNVLIFANQKLAQDRYTLVFEDDKCSGKDGAAIAHRFANVLKLQYVAGIACSSVALATARVYEQSKTLMMITAASAAAISQGGEYVFRTMPSDKNAAQVLATYMLAHYKHVGILTEQTEYSQAFLQSFEESSVGSPTRLTNEYFLTDATDLRSILLKFKQKNIEALFLNAQSESTFLASLRQLRELGITTPVFGAYYPGSKVFLDKAKDLANGIIYVDLPDLSKILTPEGTRLYDEYKKQFGELASLQIVFVSAFEGFRALDQAIQSKQEIRSYLNTTTFHGLFGDWRFDQNGDIEGLKFVLKKIESGMIKEL